MLGQILGRYKLIAELGAGGMGMVYRAEHTRIGGQVALKVLRPEFTEKPDIIQRFFNEARASGACSHPGIVKIFDFDYHEDGSAYIAMELLHGESLRQRVKRQGALAPDDAIRIVRQCASALSVAHKAEIIHRDLKPGNIFLAQDEETEGGERAKILDFGIAKLSASLSGGDLRTQTDTMMGTPVYMSPEQCRGAGRVDYRSDIYSLACVLFRIVCGRAPFQGEGVGEIIVGHVTEPLPPMRSFEPSISPALEAVVAKAMAKEPAQRYQSMNEFGVALRALRRGTSHFPVSGPTSSSDSSGTLAEIPNAIDAQTTGPMPASHRRLGADAQPGQVSQGEGAAPAITTPRLHSDPTALSPPDAKSNTTLSGIASQREAGSRPRRRRSLLIAGFGALAFIAGVTVALLPDENLEPATTPGASSASQAMNHKESADFAEAPASDERTEELIATAKQALSARKWHEATSLAQQVISKAPQNPIAPRIATLANQESKHASSYQGLLEALDDEEYVAAAEAMKGIGEGSVYFETASTAYDEARENTLAKAHEYQSAGRCDELKALAAKVPETWSAVETASSDCQQEATPSMSFNELMRVAQASYTRGAYWKAHTHCRQALTQAPRDGEALLLCGLTACSLKNKVAAKRYYRRAPKSAKTKINTSCAKAGIVVSPVDEDIMRQLSLPSSSGQ